jgi:uncharacterized protein (DUF362 family)
MQIARSIIEADFLINVPVMKTHVAVGISICMNNLMGTISAEQKKKFHLRADWLPACTITTKKPPRPLK